jgi:hypothetical protein
MPGLHESYGNLNPQKAPDAVIAKGSDNMIEVKKRTGTGESFNDVEVFDFEAEVGLEIRRQLAKLEGKKVEDVSYADVEKIIPVAMYIFKTGKGRTAKGIASMATQAYFEGDSRPKLDIFD